MHQERFAFGQGWRVERFSAHILAPEPQPIIGFPRTYSPSTTGTIIGDVVRVDIRSDADFAKYRGTLKDKIVLPQPARPVRMLEDRLVLRMNEDDIAEALTTPIPPGGGAGRPGGPPRPSLAEQTAQFFVAEGVAALLERGSDNDRSAGGSDLSWQTQRVDGGTVFPGSGGSRDPRRRRRCRRRPLRSSTTTGWCGCSRSSIPVPRRARHRRRPSTPRRRARGNGINTIAEIPGSDLADEVVILGAHLDTTPGATGATDNATGAAAMMEAVRVIKAWGCSRDGPSAIALWGGEEQGLLGSRAYVAEHYGTRRRSQAGARRTRGVLTTSTTAPAGSAASGAGQSRRDGAVRSVDGRRFRTSASTSSARARLAATDHASFDAAGLPGFQFIQERLEYNSRTHHSNMDFVDRVQREDLVQQAAVAAVFAWYTANWPEKVPRKALPTPATP